MKSISNNYGISEKSYSLILDSLKNCVEINKAVLFGSRATGNAKEGSDIDIAVFGESLTNKVLDKLKTELNENEPIPYFIDILIYDDIENKELKNHIREEGKIIFERK
ncbi:MAG: nucleotidyltransferase domain-containing protein [Melioribacteraceae bacterium]|nr:nucleotidyltransferase domain-containing protein [Melioribacteraceae bacterium]